MAGIIIGFPPSRVVGAWLVAGLSISGKVGRFRLGSSSLQWSLPQLLLPQMWRTPPPTLNQCGRLMYPFWTFSVLLARSGLVLPRAGQRRSSVAKKKGNGTSVCHGLPFTFSLFNTIEFAFKWFPGIFTSSVLIGWFLLFISYNPIGGIFLKDKCDFTISFLFPQGGLQEWS